MPEQKEVENVEEGGGSCNNNSNNSGGSAAALLWNQLIRSIISEAILFILLTYSCAGTSSPAAKSQLLEKVKELSLPPLASRRRQ